MTIRLGSTVVNRADLDTMTDFCSAGRVPDHRDPDDCFVVLVDPEGNEFCVRAVESL